MPGNGALWQTDSLTGLRLHEIAIVGIGHREVVENGIALRSEADGNVGDFLAGEGDAAAEGGVEDVASIRPRR